MSTYRQPKPEIRWIQAQSVNHTGLSVSLLTQQFLIDNEETVSQLRADFMRQAVTTRAADRDRLEHFVRRIYGDFNVQPPAVVVWFDSPLVCAATVHLLRELYGMKPYAWRLPRNAQMPIGWRFHPAFGESTRIELRAWLEAAVTFDLTLVDQEVMTRYARWLMDHPNTNNIDADRLSGRVIRREKLEEAAHQLSVDLGSRASKLPAGHPLSESDVDKQLRQAERLMPIHSKLVQGGEWIDNLLARLSSPTSPRSSRFGLIREVPAAQAVHIDSRVSHRIQWRDSTSFTGCHSPLLDASEMFLLRVSVEAGLSHPAACGRFFEAFDAGGWWWPFDGICLAADNPQAIHLADALPHHETEAAIRFNDWQIFAVRGILVPENVVRNQFSLVDIQSERNVEVRRIMMERFGLWNYLQMSGAQEVQRDECGVLYKTEVSGDESLVMVQVTNKTPEPDGTFKMYHLRVPPHITTARQAVAWSFNLSEDEYAPARES